MEGDSDESCSICLEQMLHPLKLPCTHSFCYLCIKGVTTNQGPRCAMCRQAFPARLISQPTIVEESYRGETEVWFYEGRNGWWQYDMRTNALIEAAFLKGDEHVEVMIAGHMYTIDFNEKLQYQSSGLFKKRKIKRDRMTNIEHRKGTAGIPKNEVDLQILNL